MQRSILCYGDSNTWGYVPTNHKNLPPQRYPRSMRWTGVLQNLLGEQYYVIEEGLNSRTTNLDYFIAPDRNGKTYLPSCLYTHAPLDLVILALGGNDLKASFMRTPSQVCDGLLDLINIIKTSFYGFEMQNAPHILILSPPKIQKIAESFVGENGNFIFEGILQKAEKLSELYKVLAAEQDCYFLDISQDISTSTIDGLHFDSKAHRELAKLICLKLKDIYDDKS